MSAPLLCVIQQQQRLQRSNREAGLLSPRSETRTSLGRSGWAADEALRKEEGIFSMARRRIFSRLHYPSSSSSSSWNIHYPSSSCRRGIQNCNVVANKLVTYIT